jgi:hypothetical protein
VVEISSDHNYMSDFQKNSLARIKLWLDIPFYLQYVTEEELDTLILQCGLQESDVKDSLSQQTTNLDSINPSIMSEIDWHHTDTKFERGNNGKYITKEVTTYHYSVPTERNSNLIRAIINKKNPELAKYGYTIYTIYSDIGDFYVRFDSNYSLYINFHAYMTGDTDKVLAGIYNGLANIKECSKHITTKMHMSVLKKLKSSEVYKNILKL